MLHTHQFGPVRKCSILRKKRKNEGNGEAKGKKLGILFDHKLKMYDTDTLNIKIT